MLGNQVNRRDLDKLGYYKKFPQNNNIFFKIFKSPTQFMGLLNPDYLKGGEQIYHFFLVLMIVDSPFCSAVKEECTLYDGKPQTQPAIFQ